MNRLCVYCASNDGKNPMYVQLAAEFGAMLANRDIGVVFGGGRAGLMGALADGALKAGGEAIGVMPHALVQREVAHTGLTKLHIVATMHERKALLEELSDGFVALPGGIGTMEELFETWTWAHLGVHTKPIGLLDVNNFWQPFSALVEHMGAQGFLRANTQELLLIDSDGGRLVDRMSAYQAPALTRWVRPGET